MLVEVGKNLDPATAKSFARGANPKARPVKYNPTTGLVSMYEQTERTTPVRQFGPAGNLTGYQRALEHAAMLVAGGLTTHSRKLVHGRWEVSAK